MLEIGSTPVLALRDTDGDIVNLESYRGKRVFIYFMRTISCPQCNAAVQKMIANRERYEANDVEVIVAVPDGQAEAAAWRLKRKVPFPVVLGQTGTAHAEVGLLRKVFGLVQQSGSILLDRNGVVRYAHASTNPGASHNEVAVAAAIAALEDRPSQAA